MNEANPYAPPKAMVAEIETAAPLPPNPHVLLACKLIFANVAVAIVPGLVTLSTVYRTAQTAVFVGTVVGQFIGMAIGLLLAIWVVRKLRLGRNWMRWLLTGANIAGFLLMAGLWSTFRPIFVATLASSPVTAVGTGVQFVIGLVVLVLIHTPSARQWFAAHSAARGA